MRHYAGIEMTREGVSVWPDMPERLRRVFFRVQFRGRWLEVEITRERLRVALDATEPGPIPVCLQGLWHQLPSGGEREVPLRPPAHRQEPGEPQLVPRVHVDESRLAGVTSR
jgi:trehalose/maltose hydrolase-like predicted phosphorylase